MYLQSSVIRVRVSPEHHEHKRTSFVRDRYGDLFELCTAHRGTLYSSIPRLRLRDDYSARRFVDQFQWESHEWMCLLHELQIHVEQGALLSHDYRGVIVRVLQAGLEVRQLPRLEPHLGLEGVRGLRYCFLPGPTPLPDTLNARHEPISTQAQAQKLINSLSFDEGNWSSLVHRAGQYSQTTNKTPAGYKAELTSWLASEQVLAYAVRDISDAQTQVASSVTSSDRVESARATASPRAPGSAGTAAGTREREAAPLGGPPSSSSEAPQSPSAAQKPSNPKLPPDVVEDPRGVYGYMPTAACSVRNMLDFTNPEQVAKARATRTEYLEGLEHKRAEVEEYIQSERSKGRTDDEIGRMLVDKRNSDRMATYKDNAEGLARMKARNAEKYGGRENGPDYDYLIEKGKTPEEILYETNKSNPAMDILLGLKDPKVGI